MRNPTVAIVGLPNVGKSTFFNRCLGRRVSIVHRKPGVTRDRIRADAEWGGSHFTLIDTGGIVDPREGSIEKEIMKQVEVALREADLILFMVDARLGLSPLEAEVADMMRKSKREVILVANKVDTVNSTGHYEHTKLGLGLPFPISAANGTGVGDLLDAVIEKLPKVEMGEEENHRIKVAVLGRPNAGKSSFVNRVLGEERVIVSEEPGTTRDSVDSAIRYMGHEVVIVDTAGLKKKSKVTGSLEFYASRRVLDSLEKADVIIILLDPIAGIGKQDFRIAELAEERGKGLLFAVNKWDLVKERERKAVQIKNLIYDQAPGFSYVPIVFISSLTGLRVRNILRAILETSRERSKRIPTSEFNKVLSEIVREYQPPQARGRNVKILYGSQVATAPPRFVVFASFPSLIHTSYRRYLVKKIREKLGFQGVPVILTVRGKGKDN
ncbi:MAG: ribosome biogenesis GTPase Der [Candidatus Glassbacteria bacterium]